MLELRPHLLVPRKVPCCSSHLQFCHLRSVLDPSRGKALKHRPSGRPPFPPPEAGSLWCTPQGSLWPIFSLLLSHLLGASPPPALHSSQPHDAAHLPQAQQALALCLWLSLAALSSSSFTRVDMRWFVAPQHSFLSFTSIPATFQ